MRKPPQRRFYAANDYGYVGINFFKSIAIYVDASVGTFSYVAAFAVYVAAALYLGDGIVVDHAVDNSA